MPIQTFSNDCENHGNNSSRTRLCDKSDSIASNEEVDNKKLYTLLNSIVLQYLGLLGLTKTYSSFLQESQDEGFPIPSGTSTTDKLCSASEANELRYKDVEELMKHFDEEKPEELMEKWESILQKCRPENQLEVWKVNVQLGIYALVVLPSRHQCTDDEKQLNINRLIEDFKSRNHDDVNDPELLSLYALPYVSNPVQHPVFSKFFTKGWIDNLRKSLKRFTTSHCKQLPDPFETDLAKLYRVWANTNDAMQGLTSTKLNSPHGTVVDLKLRSMPSSSYSMKQLKLPEDSSFKAFFDGILQLKEENEKLTRSDNLMKDIYMQKIQLCDALVTCLKELYTENGEITNFAVGKLLKQYSQTTLSDSTTCSDTSISTSSRNVFASTPGSVENLPLNSGRYPECEKSQGPPSARVVVVPSPRKDSNNTSLTQTPRSTKYQTTAESAELTKFRDLFSPKEKSSNRHSGTGDTYEQIVPPPPSNFESGNSLLTGRHTNQILSRLVRESANIDEEYPPSYNKR